MWSVAIETSGRQGSVALLADGECREERLFAPGPRHGRDILPTIAAILELHEVPRTSVEMIAVSTGPGSFTGLRIGVACAKTLAWALGWCLIGVPSLDVIAQNVADDVERICPVIDARREFVYARVYERQCGFWRPCSDLIVGPPREVSAAVPAGTFVFGDGVRVYPAAFGPERFVRGDEALMVGRARHTGRLAYERYQAGGRDDPLAVVPRYFRVTEAEEKLSQRSL